MRFKKLPLLLLSLFSLCVTGCSTGGNDNPPKEPQVNYVSLNKTELTLEKGQTEKLVATVNADEGAQYTLKWSSSDADIVFVDQLGNISALEKGLAIVLAEAGSKSAYCNIEVTEKEPIEPIIIKYTISFDSNGGTGNVADIEMEEGNYVLPDNPFNAPVDKEFKCWEVNGVEKEVGSTILVNQNIVIKAIWKDVPVILTGITLSNITNSYLLNDDFVKPTVTANYSNKTSKDVSDKAIISGYNMSVKGNQTVTVFYTEGEITKIALYQIYVKDPQDDVKTYTISFDSNGGSGTMTALTVEEGEISQPSCLFTAPSGKVFDAWLIKGQETPLDADAKINVNADIILVAQWKDNPKNLASIAVSSAKTEYTQNEVFVKPTVTATLLDGTTKDVSSKAVFSGYNTSSVGQQTVTVSYTENEITKTTTYKITITALPEPNHRDGDTKANTTITTKAIPNMDDEFILGMDASAVPSLEASGVKYYDFDGKQQDVFKILADNGINYIRVRIWNDPYDSNGNGYGGGNCDVDNAIAIGKRASEYGMKLLVDFHYSDFWADPAKQTAPKAWADYTLEQKKTAVYNFTKDTLQEMKDENITVGMVQVGNETNQMKMCGVTDRSSVAQLMNQGSKAVREIYPTALVATHFTNPEKTNFSSSMASYLNQYNVDYDVFGTSYYPYWHGTLDNLSSVLSSIATKYNKKVMVMETSYAYRSDDTDFFGNTSPKDSDVKPHDITIQGQYDQIYDVINTIKNNTTKGIGVCYWEGTWISVGTSSWNANKALWEKYGSGWASDAAAEYDQDVKEYGGNGCAVDNQAFFSEKGNVLHSIKVFNRDGQEGGGEEGGDDTPSELLVNGGFETGSTSPWVCSLTNINTFSVKTDCSYEGSNSGNVYHDAIAHFTITQTIENVKEGEHTFGIGVMSSFADYEITMFVSDGTNTLLTKEMSLLGWETWDYQSDTFDLENQSNLIVGLDISFTSAGGWLYIDGASLI